MSPRCSRRCGSTWASGTRATSACRAGSCCSLASTGRSCAAGRAGRGSAASTAGRRWPAGSGARCPSCRRPRPRPSSSGAGWRVSVPAPRRTSAGGPAGRRARFAPRWRRVGAVEVDLDGQAGLRPPRRPGADAGARALGRPPPLARPDDDGLEGARLVPGRPQGRPLRHERQRRADDLGRRADRRRLGVRADGEVVTKLLEDVGREASASVDAEAARLTEWLQAAAVVPRFPTPLHKELTR